MAVVKKYFSSKMPRGGGHVLVRGDAADRGFVHLDGVGHGLQVERAQVLDAEHQEGVLLAHDLARHLEDGRARWSRLFTSQVALAWHSDR